MRTSEANGLGMYMNIIDITMISSSLLKNDEYIYIYDLCTAPKSQEKNEKEKSKPI